MHRQATMKLASSMAMIVLTMLLVFPAPGNTGTFVSGIANPTGLAIHPSERMLYVKSGSSGTVWRIPIKTNGTAGTIEVVTDQFHPALDIKFDSSSNLYGVYNSGGIPIMERIDATGAVCSQMLYGVKPVYSGIAIEAPGLPTNSIFIDYDHYGDDMLSSTTLSSVTCSGNVYPEDRGKTCGQFRFMLYRASRSDLVGSYGSGVSSININNGSCSSLVSGMVQPNGLAEDSEGNLYIADAGAGKIIKRTNLGVTTELATGLKSPTGLVYDAETGLLFISETSANRIVTFAGGVALSGTVSLGVRNSSGQWSKAVKIPKGTSPVQPAAALDEAGNLYVFIIKSDNRLYMNKRSATGTWGAWTKVPGTVQSSSAPTAVAANGQILLYVRAFDDQVWENAFSTSTKQWGGWTKVKGFATPTSPEVTADLDGNVYLLIRGMR